MVRLGRETSPSFPHMEVNTTYLQPSILNIPLYTTSTALTVHCIGLIVGNYTHHVLAQMHAIHTIIGHVLAHWGA